MSRSVIAASLDAPVGAYSVLSDFFAPIEALGSAPARMVRWLRDAGIGERHTLLDLGCGKGAVSLAAARALGCRVVGVDGFGAFVRACSETAAKRDLSDRCRFVESDVRALPRRLGGRERFDVVLILNVLPVDKAVVIARRWTRAGGVYVVDDAVSVEKSDTGAPTAEAARAILEKRGDRIECERVWSRAEVLRRERALYRSLEANARRLMRTRPEVGPIVRACLVRQRRAIGHLTGPIRPACWLVRRGTRR